MGLKARKTPWQIRAEKALTESIAHWERMRDKGDDSGERPLDSDCACCQEFRPNWSCTECPVALRTGQDGCVGTPYMAAYDAAVGGRSRDDWYGLRSPEFKAAALAEIVFLRDTLRMVQSGEVKP